jgi:hypothetical protein
MLIRRRIMRSSGRSLASSPPLPDTNIRIFPGGGGRRENEVLGPFDMHILMQE